MTPVQAFRGMSPGTLSGRAFAIALSAFALTAPAAAQQVSSGEAFVTKFSGFTGSGADATIDLDGIVGQVVDIRHPGAAAAGRAWRNAPTRPYVTAGDIGQVFGIAVDNRSPANIYLTATSAFGLHLNAAGNDWMDGQWGAAGGPGTIYKLSAENNFQPEVFTHIHIAGRTNTGAGLGNIAFDRANRQFFVSDLETGMIHRIGLTGADLGHYDHGMVGRTNFVDAASGEAMSLPGIAFDADSTATLSCPTPFARTPECWNFADFRRRVWGLASHRFADTGENRLYYAVWSSQAFGNDEWAADPAEQQNTLWSIAIRENGTLDTDSVRRELVIPGFFTAMEDYARAGGSHPVTDIAISETGEMALAERGGIRNLGLGEAAAFATPDEARVLRLRRNNAGLWQPVGRHDIGFYERATENQPHIRAAASGGVAFGFGYNASGRIDNGQRDAFLWATGDRLCRAGAPCADNDAAPLFGLQGQPDDVMAEIAPAPAYADYPNPGPATPPTGPDQAYMVESETTVPAGPQPDNLISSWTGDVEIYRTGGTPGPSAPDLAVSKSMPPACLSPGICTGRVTVTNVGTAAFSGPIFLTDVTTPGGLGIGAYGAPWSCSTLAGDTYCYHPPVTLSPGQSRTLLIDLAVPAGFVGSSLSNCAELTWPLETPSDPSSIIRAVQVALTLLGYNPGPIDGVLGPATATAIALAKQDFGLPANGLIDAALLQVLFSGHAYFAGDGNPANDRACDTAPIIAPPAGGVHLPVGSLPGHVPPASIHNPIGSGPGHVFPASIHWPAGSVPGHAFPLSIHLPIGSGPGHVFPASIHLPVGSGGGHVFPASIHWPIGSGGGHVFPASIHLPVGSGGGHVFPASIHWPIGSGGGHVFPASIHWPIGSGGGHVFPASIHWPIGSGGGHVFPASIHLPVGSGPGHFFPASIHWPIGSGGGHVFPASIHLPIGSGGGHVFPASIHFPVGSNLGHIFPISIHIPFGSNPGHVFPASIHLPIGSGGGHVFPISIHLPPGSNPGHNFPQSLHFPIGSNFAGNPPIHPLVQSLHLPVGSGPGHFPAGSLHFPIGSGGHQPAGSFHVAIISNLVGPGGAHTPIESAMQQSPQNLGNHTPFLSIHLPVGSGGHLPIASVHVPLGSAQHTTPPSIHLPVGSVAQPGGLTQPPSPAPSQGTPHRPQGSIHLPVGSQQPAHTPPGSQTAPHQPRGSVHLPIGSTQQPPTHSPTASQPVHTPPGSRPTHTPSASQPTHTPPGSVQIHRPIGSQPTLHLPLGSQQTQPPTTQPPTTQPHLPRGSVTIHQPIGSRPTLHLPLGSQQTTTPPTTSKPPTTTTPPPTTAPHLPAASLLRLNPNLLQQLQPSQQQQQVK